MIGTGRAADRDTVLGGLGADAFVDLQADRLEDVGKVDVVFDVIGGEVAERSAPLVRAGGTLITIVGPPKVRPAEGRAIFFVVEPDRATCSPAPRDRAQPWCRPPGAIVTALRCAGPSPPSRKAVPLIRCRAAAGARIPGPGSKGRAS